MASNTSSPLRSTSLSLYLSLNCLSVLAGRGKEKEKVASNTSSPLLSDPHLYLTIYQSIYLISYLFWLGEERERDGGDPYPPNYLSVLAGSGEEKEKGGEHFLLSSLIPISI